MKKYNISYCSLEKKKAGQNTFYLCCSVALYLPTYYIKIKDGMDNFLLRYIIIRVKTPNTHTHTHNIITVILQQSYKILKMPMTIKHFVVFFFFSKNIG